MTACLTPRGVCSWPGAMPVPAWKRSPMTPASPVVLCIRSSAARRTCFSPCSSARIEDRAAQNERVTAEFSGADGVRELMRVANKDAAAEPGWPYLLAEFRVIAMRDAELNRRYAAAHARTVDGITSVLESLYTPIGLEPPVPLRSLAEFMQAGAVGIALNGPPTLTRCPRMTWSSSCCGRLPCWIPRCPLRRGDVGNEGRPLGVGLLPRR